jgi:hypothetical protein
MRNHPHGVTAMLEAAVWCGRTSHNAAAAAATANQTAALQAIRFLIDEVLVACAEALAYDVSNHDPSTLTLLLIEQEREQVAKSCLKAGGALSLSNYDAASYAAALAAAAEAGQAAAQQDRQQLQLRLASLLCSCVKALAAKWQHMSWRSVLDGCCLAVGAQQGRRTVDYSYKAATAPN